MPVGYAIEDKEVSIVDEEGEPVPPGEIGEIAVRSAYLSPGYWRRPDLTAKAFPPDAVEGDRRLFLTGDLGRWRQDGLLEHLGRNDGVVMIRGLGVVLREVEAALLACQGVAEAAVVVQEGPDGDKRLVAYLVPADSAPLAVDDVRQALAQTLADYMIPARFVTVDALLLTPAGKVDRRGLSALPIPFERPNLGVPYVPPALRSSQ